MAGAEEEIAQLKLRLQEADKNTIMAATYGKQLLDENHELHSQLQDTTKNYSMKLEELEQEKHALTLKLETKVQNEQSLFHELEQIREQQTELIKEKVACSRQSLEEEIQKLNKKVAHMEGNLEREQSENQQNMNHARLMEAQLKEAQERLDYCNTSIHDQSTDEMTASLQSQIMTITCEKQELEKQVSMLTAQLHTSKLNLSLAKKEEESLKSEVENLQCQSTGYYNALEQNKEEILELKMEIDALKLGETDPGKKGNSLFAEVEDQRQVMEKRLQEYKNNYNILKRQCEMKTDQICKMKLQLANLLSLSNNKSDAEYVTHLEESLSRSRIQLEEMKKQWQTHESKAGEPVIQQPQSAVEAEESTDQNMTNFFKNMFLECQKKMEVLEQSLQTAQFDKVTMSDRILQLQRKLHQAESLRDASNSKLLALQVRFEELANKKGEIISDASKKTARQVTEKIPGFESTSRVKTERKSIEKETRIPLQEKPTNINIMSENIQSKEDSHPIKESILTKEDAKVKLLTEENQENKEVMCSYEHKKKAKKSVRMTEIVVVQECDGEVQEAELKKEGEEKVPQVKKKVLRKMNAPVVKVPSGGQPNECNQQ